MQHSTTEPYQLKREIPHFTKKISAGVSRDWQKFTADMMYGILTLEGYECGETLVVEPNTNLLYARTMIPTLHARIPRGESLLDCAVLGAVTDCMAKWQNKPSSQDVAEAMKGTGE